jgi:hypothetical protein
MAGFDCFICRAQTCIWQRKHFPITSKNRTQNLGKDTPVIMIRMHMAPTNHEPSGNWDANICVNFGKLCLNGVL